VFALYLLLRQTGLLNLLLPSQLAAEGMGYGMLFIVGLLTSVHCLAMCGGINLSQSMTKDTAQAALSDSGSTSPSRSAFMRPVFYNLGRVISYTTIGALVGALGSVLSFSPQTQGVLKLVAGVVMLIMGLNLLGAFPQLRRFMPRPPQAFAKLIGDKQETGARPLLVGLLNGLMPCGPLQAMQIYALSTASAVAGALAMLVFSLGTVPLVLGVGLAASALTKRFKQRAMTAGAVLVLVLGLALFSQGWALSGINLPGLNLLGTSGSSLSASQTSASSQESAAQESSSGENATAPWPIVDGVQVIETSLERGSYPIIEVQAGTPVRWTIAATEQTINGCNSRFIIPEYGIEYSFEPGANIIEFTPERAGTYPYSCWMGMIRGTIIVI
jgi:sulfite exporter TauE/SafE